MVGIKKPTYFVFGNSSFNFSRKMRSGTENIYGIVGFAKALELATKNYEADKAYISDLKKYMIHQFCSNVKNVSFNGDVKGCSLYTVLSVNFPKTEKSGMILSNLDTNNICVSGGSACNSGADKGSHVIAAINPDADCVTIRFSFSRNNTKEEVDTVVEKLKTLI